jgi:hypothetical protein
MLGKKPREEDLGGSVQAAASVASTHPGMSTNARPLRFARAADSEFGRKPRNGCPTRSMAVTSEINVFMNFDHPVVLPKRGHGIEVRIN